MLSLVDISSMVLEEVKYLKRLKAVRQADGRTDRLTDGARKKVIRKAL